MKRFLMAIGILVMIGSAALAQQRTEITLMYGLGGRLGELIRETVNRFNQSQNQVTVRAEFGVSYPGVLQRALAGIAAGQPAADLLQLEVALWPRLAEANHLLDLSTLPGFRSMFDGYWPVFRRQVDPDGDGRVFAIPWNMAVPVTYFNPVLLRQAGFEAPPRRWSEFPEFARRVRAATGVPALALPTSPDTWVLEGAIFSNGGEMMRNNRLALNEPRALEVINLWTSMIREGTAVIRARELGTAQQDFIAGRVAVMFLSVASRPGLKALAGEERFRTQVRVARFPYFLAPAVPVGGATLAIPRGVPEERVRAAWTFIQWLNTPEQQLAFIRETNWVPIARATNDLPAFQRFLLSEQGLGYGMLQLPAARPRPTESGYLQAMTEINRTLEDIWINNRPVEASINDLVNRTANLFR
jgi:sn-glycerol 3-phosphate transport system substrate-binding protein